MTNLRIIILILHLCGLSLFTTFAQDTQSFSLLFSSYFTNDFHQDEFYTGTTNGNYGIGGELRYRFNKKGEPIKTAVGIVYHQLSFKQAGERLTPGPIFNSKIKFHHISIPYYFWGNIGQNTAINLHFSLEIPFLKTTRSFEGTTLLNKQKAGIKPINNIGVGAGLALRQYISLKKNHLFFVELFFKRHALFAGLSSNENFYLDRIKKPYSIGLNIGTFLN